MIRIGDYIQWESCGCDFFPEPRRVREISPCGQFLFVEDEVCGLPAEQCYKVADFGPGGACLNR